MSTPNIAGRPSVTLPRLWLAAAVVAALGTWLAFDAMPGINWTVWTVVAVVGFVVFQRAGGKGISWDRAVPLALACVLAGGASITADPGMQALIALAVIAIAATSLLLAGGFPTARLGAIAIAFAPLTAGVTAIGEAVKRAGEGARVLRAERSLPWLRGGALATPVIVVFALLLSGADPTLAAWRDDVAGALAQLSFIPRLIFFGVLGTGVLGAYGVALRPQGEWTSWTPVLTPVRRTVLSDVERLIVLGSVAALFALFFALQLSYLFGNPGAQSGSGVTFADAVHRGFGELTICATLVALLMIALDNFAQRGARESAVRFTSIAIVVETQLLLLSAYHRVDLYEAAYGYTTQRVYVQVYTLLVSLAMTMLGWEIWSSIDVARLTRRVAVAGGVALAALSYWNHSAWIAARNLDRYAATGKLDVRYFTEGLAPDAIPFAAASLARLKPEDAAQARACLRMTYARHARGLGAGRDVWYEWNQRRIAIRPALINAGVLVPNQVPKLSTADLDSCRRP